MPPLTALLDACVLYPAPLRDLLLRLAVAGLFHAKWSDDIHDEWCRNLLANRADLKPEQLRRTRELMNQAVPDCLITGHHRLIPSLRLPDPDDRHVLAAAIRGKASVIVTFNQKDFPATTLEQFGIQTRHPDEFLSLLLKRDHAGFCTALRNQRAALRVPRVSAEELLKTLESLGLAVTVAQLRASADPI